MSYTEAELKNLRNLWMWTKRNKRWNCVATGMDPMSAHTMAKRASVAFPEGEAALLVLSPFCRPPYADIF